MLEKSFESSFRKNVVLIIKEEEVDGKVYKDMYIEFANNFTVAVKPAFHMTAKQYRILMDLLEDNEHERA